MTESPPTSINLERAAHKKLHTLYLLDNCPLESGLLVFKSVGKTPYYKIFNLGSTSKELITISGIQLVIEKKIS